LAATGKTPRCATADSVRGPAGAFPLQSRRRRLVETALPGRAATARYRSRGRPQSCALDRQPGGGPLGEDCVRQKGTEPRSPVHRTARPGSRSTLGRSSRHHNVDQFPWYDDYFANLLALNKCTNPLVRQSSRPQSVLIAIDRHGDLTPELA